MSKYDILSVSGRIGQATKKGQPTTTLEGDLAVARIERAIRKHLAAAPPLDDAQKAYLRGVVEGVTQ